MLARAVLLNVLPVLRAPLGLVRPALSETLLAPCLVVGEELIATRHALGVTAARRVAGVIVQVIPMSGGRQVVLAVLRAVRRARDLLLAGEVPIAERRVRHVIARRHMTRRGAEADRTAQAAPSEEDQRIVPTVGDRRPTQVAPHDRDQQTVRTAPRVGSPQIAQAETLVRMGAVHSTGVQAKARRTNMAQAGAAVVNDAQANEAQAREAHANGAHANEAQAPKVRANEARANAELVLRAVATGALIPPAAAAIARRGVTLGLRCGIQRQADVGCARPGSGPRAPLASAKAVLGVVRRLGKPVAANASERPTTIPSKSSTIQCPFATNRRRSTSPSRSATSQCHSNARPDRQAVNVRKSVMDPASSGARLRHNAVKDVKLARKANAFKRYFPVPGWDRVVRWKTGSAPAAFL